MRRIWKPFLSTGLLIAAIASSALGARGGEAEAASFVGNLKKITTAEDFEAGSLENVLVEPEIGDGALVLEENALSGSFESAVYEGSTFSDMVACWNAAIYEGGQVEVFARARCGGQWTKYLTWGPFTPFDTRGTKENKEDEAAFVDQDTFCMADEKTADAFQMKVVLRREDAGIESPVVRMVSMTFRGGDMVPVYAEEPVKEIPDKVLIESPAVSQLIRAPWVAKDICSPATMTVMMNSRVPELNILPDEYALSVRDEEEDIFGSWAFTVAGAGLYGFEAYPQFADFDIIMQELAKGHVTGVNLRYTYQEDGDRPYLEGVFDWTGGHLLCLIGYEYEDGVRDDDHLYFYSADSFTDSDRAGYRRYKWTQLKECLSGMAYIIPDDKQEVTGEYAQGIIRKSVELRRDENRKDTWIFCENGEDIDLERCVSGDGFYAVSTVDNEDLAPIATDHSIVYEKAVFTEANQEFYYGIVNRRDGSLVLNREELAKKLDLEDADAAIKVWAVTDRGACYEAILPRFYENS